MDNYIRKSDAVYCACKVLDKFGGCKQGVFCPDFGCKEVREEFDKLPAADVVERKKGKWAVNPEEWLSSCSICGQRRPIVAGDYRWNFCPNCGADMRGDNI